jgi:ferric-dicitrate binding protein FerR (iron transport regulator)
MTIPSDNLESLICAWLDGRLTEAESKELQTHLKSSPQARDLFLKYNQLDASLRQIADVSDPPTKALIPNTSLAPEPIAIHAQANSATQASQASRFRLRAYWLAAFATCVLLLLAFTWLRPTFDEQAKIATITGLSGPIRWTGDGGRVSNELSVDQPLSGGTIDGLSPESWFELQFNDGSKLTLSGNSMLTFADDGQKILHLKSGKLSARVEEQPPNQPMLIHTRSAKLTILGTSFDVEAGLPSTEVQVSEGTVRVARTSDGQSIDVPAQHRVVAAADRALKREAVPDLVQEWKSRIEMGPSEAFGFGEWLRPSLEDPAMLRAVAFVPEEAPSVVIYLTGMGVTTRDDSSVQVSENAVFEVRGRMHFPTDLYLGVLVHHLNGEFAGKFLATCAVEHSEDGKFTASARIDDFFLDPSMQSYKGKLPSSPQDLIIRGIWCFTHSDEASGMQVSEIALSAP